MKEDIYQELINLIDIFSECSVDGERVICFEVVKRIVDGEVVYENINEDIKVKMRKQLKESFEWLQSVGVKVKFQEEFLSIIT